MQRITNSRKILRKIFSKEFFMMFSLLFFIVAFKPITRAEETATEVNLIFNKTSYQVGDPVELTINLSNFYDLYKVTLEMIVPEALEITKVKNAYVDDQSANQIFSFRDGEVAYKYYNEDARMLIYLISKTENIDEGYQDLLTTFNNRLVKINFKATADIDNINDLFFPSDNFDEKVNLFFVLENTRRKNISYTVNYFESLNYQWEEEYTYNVGEAINNSGELLNDIILLNRNINDVYMGLDLSQVNINKIGKQVIILILKDFKTKDIIFGVKYIEIIDQISPVITGIKTLEIDDSKLITTELDQNIKVTDNYCHLDELKIKYTYYTPDNIEIDSDDIKSYLTNNQRAYLKIEATDTSNNQAEPFIREIKINDKTPPTVTKIEKITLVNEEVESFVFEDLITIIDSYDKNPKLIISIYEITGQAIDEYESYLCLGKGVIIKYFGQDESFNQTQVYVVLIEVVDTIIPTVVAAAEITIFDSSIYTFDPLENVTCFDNFIINTTPTMTFYESNQTTLINGLVSFKEYLASGYSGFIKYEIVDNAGNISNPVIQKVVPVDLTKPVIKVINVASNQTYSKLENIEYLVTDNFNKKVDIVITLNGTPYNGMPIYQKGKYQLIIVATDEAGNESQVTIDFEVTNKQLFSGEGEIIEFINDNFEIIIGISVLVILSVYIIIYIIKKKKGVKK